MKAQSVIEGSKIPGESDGRMMEERERRENGGSRLFIEKSGSVTWRGTSGVRRRRYGGRERHWGRRRRAAATGRVEEVQRERERVTCTLI